ncbi:hypothetical protein [Kordiimonas lacus]|uniref:Phosphorylase superfamily protein n=1 Tax=Kordiimonas lacus TaxID=637679 RepID=A0A1G6ZR42_9PROT|nr:hypothetical protein [Kordiimonas lacus]SDE04991.1 hypothetical protein SAMN04488071_1916 [Kordiimonas lacus]
MATTRHAKTGSEPTLSLPDLPAVPWSKFGGEAPKQLSCEAGTLPAADVVILTWAEAEWAALEQVFVESSTPMPYSARNTSKWDGWYRYDWDMPSGKWPQYWDSWGEYRLVEVRGKKVLLFKSNTHLDWPGQSYLEQMTSQLLEATGASLLLSIGTAGGAELHDHEGTVRVVSSGQLYDTDYPTDPSKWATYYCDWTADDSFLAKADFTQSLFPIPTTKSDLESLASAFEDGKYDLSTLDANGLCFGDDTVKVYDMTPNKQPLVTTATFVVATDAKNSPFADKAVVEMDDAVLGKVCHEKSIKFGFVRNVSDPVQNADLPVSVQGDWGGVIYRTYGLYTSYNGALVAWAVI